jgi:hypothetical protein
MSDLQFLKVVILTRGPNRKQIEMAEAQQQRSNQNSATGTRTRVARVRAGYPNQLDYGGSALWSECNLHGRCDEVIHNNKLLLDISELIDFWRCERARLMAKDIWRSEFDSMQCMHQCVSKNGPTRA